MSRGFPPTCAATSISAHLFPPQPDTDCPAAVLPLDVLVPPTATAGCRLFGRPAILVRLSPNASCACARASPSGIFDPDRVILPALPIGPPSDKAALRAVSNDGSPMNSAAPLIALAKGLKLRSNYGQAHISQHRRLIPLVTIPPHRYCLPHASRPQAPCLPVRDPLLPRHLTLCSPGLPVRRRSLHR